MSKKEVKEGYMIKRFYQGEIIPKDAVFLRAFDETCVHSPHTGQVFKSQLVYEFLLPINNCDRSAGRLLQTV